MASTRSALAAGAVAAGLALTGLLGACSSDPPTAAEQREADVERRLQQTFSDQQTTCIMKRLDPATIGALDRSVDLPADADALASYSEAVAVCVAGPAATTAPPATTTSSTTSTTPGE